MMDNRMILSAGFVGGLVAGALNSIPVLNFINCFCCLGIMLGGAVAIMYYDRSEPGREYISPAIAVTLGISAGLFGAFIALAIDYIIYVNFGHWQLEFMRDIMENLNDVPPEMEEIIHEVENELEMGFVWGIALLRNLLVMPVFCLIGSLITRALINRNRIPTA